MPRRVLGFGSVEANRMGWGKGGEGRGNVTMLVGVCVWRKRVLAEGERVGEGG